MVHCSFQNFFYITTSFRYWLERWSYNVSAKTFLLQCSCSTSATPSTVDCFLHLRSSPDISFGPRRRVNRSQIPVDSRIGGSRQEQHQNFSKDASTVRTTVAHSNWKSCLGAKTGSSTATSRCERTLDEPYEYHPTSKWKTQASRGKLREDSKWDCNTTRSCAGQPTKRHFCGGSRRYLRSVHFASRKRRTSCGLRRRK